MSEGAGFQDKYSGEALTLSALDRQIAAHDKAENDRSILGWAVSKVWRQDDNSLDTMRVLSEKAHAAAAKGDRDALQAMQRDISKTIEADKKTIILQNEISHYAGTGFKTAALFVGGTKASLLANYGKVGLASTVTLYGLDQAKVSDDFGTGAANFVAGGFKGGLTKAAFHKIGGMSHEASMARGGFQKSLAESLGPKVVDSMAFKGALMGGSARALEVGLTGSTYYDAQGKRSILGGIDKVVSETLDPKRIAVDAVLFGTTDKFANFVTGGHAARPFYRTVVTSGTLGLGGGSIGEYERQVAAGEDISLKKIAFRGLLEGGVMTIAGVPGGLVADPVFRKSPLETVKNDLAKGGLARVLRQAPPGELKTGTLSPTVELIPAGDAAKVPAAVPGEGTSKAAEAVGSATPAVEVAAPKPTVVEAPAAEVAAPKPTVVEAPAVEVAAPKPPVVEAPAAEVAAPKPTVVEAPAAEVAAPKPPAAEVPVDASRVVPRAEAPVAGALDSSGLWEVAGARAPVGDVSALKLDLRLPPGVEAPAVEVAAPKVDRVETAPRTQPEGETTGEVKPTPEKPAVEREAAKPEALEKDKAVEAESAAKAVEIARVVAEAEVLVKKVPESAKPADLAELYELLSKHPEADAAMRVVYEQNFHNLAIRRALEGFYKTEAAAEHEPSLGDARVRESYDRIVKWLETPSPFHSAPLKMAEHLKSYMGKAEAGGVDIRPALEHYARSSRDMHLVRIIDVALGTKYGDLLAKYGKHDRRIPMSDEEVAALRQRQKFCDDVACGRIPMPQEPVAKPGEVNPGIGLEANLDSLLGSNRPVDGVSKVAEARGVTPEMMAKAQEALNQKVATALEKLNSGDPAAARAAALELSQYLSHPNAPEWFEAWRAQAADSVPLGSLLNSAEVRALPTETVTRYLGNDWSTRYPMNKPVDNMRAKILAVNGVAQQFAATPEVAQRLIEMGTANPQALDQVVRNLQGRSGESYTEWVKERVAAGEPIEALIGENALNSAQLATSFKDAPEVAAKLVEMAAADPNFNLSELIRRLGHPKMGGDLRDMVRERVEAGANAAQLNPDALFTELQVNRNFGRTPEVAARLLQLGAENPTGLAELIREPQPPGAADAKGGRGKPRRPEGPPDPNQKRLMFAYKDAIAELVPQAQSLGQLEAVANALKKGDLQKAFDAAVPIKPADGPTWNRLQLLMTAVATKNADVIPQRPRAEGQGGPGDRGGNGGNRGGDRGPQRLEKVREYTEGAAGGRGAEPLSNPVSKEVSTPPAAEPAAVDAPVPAQPLVPPLEIPGVAGPGPVEAPPKAAPKVESEAPAPTPPKKKWTTVNLGELELQMGEARDTKRKERGGRSRDRDTERDKDGRRGKNRWEEEGDVD